MLALPLGCCNMPPDLVEKLVQSTSLRGPLRGTPV